jgi:hypothetical protein
MFIQKSLLLTALVAVSVIQVAATEVTLPIPGDIPPSSCTLKFKDDEYERAHDARSVTVTLCPSGGECPVTIPCPDGANGLCSRYDYKFAWYGSPSFSVISVSADIGIRSISPEGIIIAPGMAVPGFDGLGEHDFGQRWVKFSSSASTVSITTDLSQPVAGTAAAKSGRKLDFCQIQTPGKEIMDTNAAIPTAVVETLACGTIQRNVDSRGFTLSIIPLTGSCTTSTDTLKTGSDQPTLFIDPNTRITFEGSSRYCWPNGFGALNCAP